MKKTKTGAKGRRRRAAAKDLTAPRRADVAGGMNWPAVKLTDTVMASAGNTLGTRSGRIGSVAVDPSDPS
jgi:hypothetical protein